MHLEVMVVMNKKRTKKNKNKRLKNMSGDCSSLRTFPHHVNEQFHDDLNESFFTLFLYDNSTFPKKLFWHS